jgi:hypothetical protein
MVKDSQHDGAIVSKPLLEALLDTVVADSLRLADQHVHLFDTHKHYPSLSCHKCSPVTQKNYIWASNVSCGHCYRCKQDASSFSAAPYTNINTFRCRIMLGVSEKLLESCGIKNVANHCHLLLPEHATMKSAVSQAAGSARALIMTDATL